MEERTALQTGRNVGRNRFFRFLLLAAALAGAAALAEGQGNDVVLEQNVPVKMRDGVVLRADVYRPKAEGKYPVLLTRTPYDKTGNASFGISNAARGYVVIAEDTRGRFASEGEWYPFKHESEDGYDTVEWAAALPYANGKVGMFGGSYVGATQFLAAIAKPPHLAGICPVVTASNYHDGWTYQGGAFEQWFSESWSTGLAMDTMRRRSERNGRALEGTRTLPLEEYTVVEGASGEGLAPYFKDWLAHPSFDAYWKQWAIEEHYNDIQVPVLHVAAWYDIFLGGSLHNFVELKKHGGTEGARAGQRLLVGVGGHASGPDPRKVGAVDFGPKLPQATDYMMRWYDWLLKGEANGTDREKPVLLFVMGRNEWRAEDDWPLPRARNTRYYLHSSGAGAKGLTGSGTLTAAAPGEESPDEYVYDPADPTPTIGGPLCCEALPTGIGPQDQRPAEARADVLVFSTAPLSRDVEVTGPVTADLWVSTSVPDSDFVARLVDVWPNGFAQNLTSGVLRLRYRSSQEKPELANPGEVYHIAVDLWATSNVFLAGHRIRVEITSSDFPRFDRNLNTGEEQARGTRMAKATNVIYHDKSRPSSVMLPIVP